MDRVPADGIVRGVRIIDTIGKKGEGEAKDQGPAPDQLGHTDTTYSGVPQSIHGADGVQQRANSLAQFVPPPPGQTVPPAPQALHKLPVQQQGTQLLDPRKVPYFFLPDLDVRIPESNLQVVPSGFQIRTTHTHQQKEFNLHGVPTVPIELKVLGSLRVLAKGWHLEAVCEVSSMDRETMRTWHHRLLDIIG